jgi:hypothetical protein
MERHPAAECAAAVATMEAATTHRRAAAVETSTARTHAAAETPSAASAAVATTTPAAARQRHCWRSQTNRRNCQQRDHCLTQHSHSMSTCGGKTDLEEVTMAEVGK